MKKKIKVGFVNYSLNVGGIETLILEICNRLNKNQFIPYVFVFEKNGKLKNEYVNSGIPLLEVKKNKGFDWMLSARLAKMLKKNNIDIVHTHNPTNWLYGTIAAKLAGISVIHTEHTTSDYHNYHVKRWELIERVLSIFTTKITTVSESVKMHMVKNSKINASKIKVVYNAIKAEEFNKSVDEKKIRASLYLQKNDVVIGNIARFYENKDHRTLLEAFKLILKQVPNVYLLLIGDGPLRNEMGEIAKNLKIKDSVKFLGNRRNIAEILRIMDVFVLSSKREGLPMVLLEAMTSGVPIVATDVDGNSELIVDKKTGFIVPPNSPKFLSNAVVQVLADKEKAIKMASRGRDFVREHFSLISMIEKYERIYYYCMRDRIV